MRAQTDRTGQATSRRAARWSRLTAARAGALAAAPFAAASVVLGMSFGILARASGFELAPTVVMSAIAFTGSAQLAAVATYAAGGGVLAAVATAASLNARYAAIGLSAGRSFHGNLLTRAVEGQFVVDEAWGVAVRPDGGVDVARLVGAGMFLYLGWVSGTVIGAAAGGSLPPPEDLGLDAAFPALFLAIAAPRLGARSARLVALTAVALTLSLTPFLPPGLPVAAAASACLLGVIRRG